MRKVAIVRLAVLVAGLALLAPAYASTSWEDLPSDPSAFSIVGYSHTAGSGTYTYEVRFNGTTLFGYDPSETWAFAFGVWDHQLGDPKFNGSGDTGWSSLGWTPRDDDNLVVVWQGGGNDKWFPGSPATATFSVTFADGDIVPNPERVVMHIASTGQSGWVTNRAPEPAAFLLVGAAAASGLLLRRKRAA